jgi:hypothetical protein
VQPKQNAASNASARSRVPVLMVALSSSGVQ